MTTYLGQVAGRRWIGVSLLVMVALATSMELLAAPRPQQADQDEKVVEVEPEQKQAAHSGKRPEDEEAIRGILVDRDGQRVADTKVLLAAGIERLRFSGDFEFEGGRRAITDKLGRFEFISLNEPGVLVVAHDRGYAEISVAELAKTGKIRLQEWAQIKVRVLRGDQPLANAKIEVRPASSFPRRVLGGLGIQKTTNDAGIATFPRVIPGKVSVGMLIERKTQRGAIVSRERFKEIAVEPGKTGWVVLGGTGQPVTGRFIVKGKPPAAHRWSANDWLTISQVGSVPAEQHRYFRGAIQDDGSFRVDDIPPGEYSLFVPLTAAGEFGDGEMLGKINRSFQVDGTAPVDLGTIEGQWDPLLTVGDPMPRFVVQKLDGEVLRSEQLLGKIVLVTFWGTWSPGSIEQGATLGKLHEQFSSDKRFQLLSISLEQTWGEAVRASEKYPCPWTRAYGGRNFDCTVPKRFDLKTISDLFLFDVDGMVLYRGDDLEQIKEIVAKRLTVLPPVVAVADVVNGAQPNRVDDSFRTGRLSAVALATFNAANVGGKPSTKGPGLVLWTARGREVRSLGGIGTHGWLTGPRRITLDPRRKRTYFCDTVNQRLLALDKSGRQLFTTPISNIHAAGVDQKTGDIWCIATAMLNDGELLVLDRDGREKTRFPNTAFGMAYSVKDDAFWLAGDSIIKMTRDGEIVRGTPIPDEAFSFGTIAVDEQQGGAWVLEMFTEGFDNSRARVWRLEPDATATIAHEFRLGVRSRAIGMAHGKLWVSTMAPAPDGHHPDRPFKWKLSRFSADGTLEVEFDIEARHLAASPDGDELWICGVGELQRIDVNGEVLQSIALPDGTEWGQVLVY